MTGKPEESGQPWTDPDDALEWTDDQIARAELAEGGRILRPARKAALPGEKPAKPVSGG